MFNTLPISRTSRLAVLASALVYTGFGVATGAAPAEAASGPYYSATLSAPATDTKAVADGVAWACKDATCVAGKTNARPLRVCRSLNRKFGQIATFKVDGQEITAEELAKCNG